MRKEIQLKKLQSQGLFKNSTLNKDAIVNRKSYNLSSVAVNSDEERTFTAICAENVVDRDGECVIVQGINLDEYKNNNVLAFDHNYSQFPLGKCTAISIDNEKMIGKFQLANTPTGLEAWELIRNNMLNAVSIGFIRNNIAKRGSSEFLSAMKKYGIQDRRDNYLKQITLESELVEISLVVVQSNRGSIIQEIASKGYNFAAKMVGCEIDNEDNTDEDFGIKPYPTEHASRQSEPENYQKFRRVNSAFGNGIDAIYGIHNGSTHIQSIRFNASKFTPEEAQQWLKDHDYKTDIVNATPHKESVKEVEPNKEPPTTNDQVSPEGQPKITVKTIEVPVNLPTTVTPIKEESTVTIEKIVDIIAEVAKDVEAVAEVAENIPAISTIAIITDKVADVIENAAEAIAKDIDENKEKKFCKIIHYCKVIREGSFKLSEEDKKNILKGKLVFK